MPVTPCWLFVIRFAELDEVGASDDVYGTIASVIMRSRAPTCI